MTPSRRAHLLHLGAYAAVIAAGAAGIWRTEGIAHQLAATGRRNRVELCQGLNTVRSTLLELIDRSTADGEPPTDITDPVLRARVERALRVQRDLRADAHRRLRLVDCKETP